MVHVGVVAYAHLAGGSVDQKVPRELRVGDDPEEREARRIEASLALEETSDESQSPLPGIDITAGLDGGSDEEPGGDPQSGSDGGATSDEPEPRQANSERASDEPKEADESSTRADRDQSPDLEPDDVSDDAPEERDSSSDDDPSVVAETDGEADSSAEMQDEPSPSDEEKTASTSGGDDGGAGADDDKLAANASGGESASTDGPGTPGASGDDNSGGAGDGEGAGGAGDGDGPGAGGGGIDRGKLLRGYADSIYELIAEHRSYPKAARRAGLEGTVHVEIKIDGAGRILGVDVHESSGHRLLDESAVEVIESIDKLPDPPQALAWEQKRLRIPIRYDLNRHG